jgi:hypothetical protein
VAAANSLSKLETSRMELNLTLLGILVSGLGHISPSGRRSGLLLWLLLMVGRGSIAGLRARRDRSCMCGRRLPCYRC